MGSKIRMNLHFSPLEPPKGLMYNLRCTIYDFFYITVRKKIMAISKKQFFIHTIYILKTNEKSSFGGFGQFFRSLGRSEEIIL
jgi:hypothetical protein